MNLEKTLINGSLKFYFKKDDKYIGQRAALGKYEPYETELILRQINKGDTAIDIGANIGYYTLLLAQKVGKKGKVYSFEPDSINFSILKKNVEDNGFKNVILVNKAVSNKNGEVILYKSKDNFGDHRVYNQNPSVPPFGGTSPLPAGRQGLEEREKVKTVRLDDYLQEIGEKRKINLIKVDTQGWEPAVIEGAIKTIKKYKPTIFFEYWPEGYKMAGLDSANMMKFCKAEYKSIFLIDDWLYIYKKASLKNINRFCEKDKKGYADCWVKKQLNFTDYLGQFKDFKIKKFVKKILIDNSLIAS